jgi:putative transposase
MKKSRYTEEQIIRKVRQHESGVKTAELCREHGVSAATFYGWKQKFGGMDGSEVQRLKALEDEDRRLKLRMRHFSVTAFPTRFLAGATMNLPPILPLMARRGSVA